MMAVRSLYSSSPSSSMTFLFTSRRINPLNNPLTYSHVFRQVNSLAYNVKEDGNLRKSRGEADKVSSSYNDHRLGSINTQNGPNEKDGESSSTTNLFKRRQKRKKISPKQLSIALQKRRENTRPPPPLELTEDVPLSKNSNSDKVTTTNQKEEEKSEAETKKEDKEVGRKMIGQSKTTIPTPRISPRQLSMALQKRRQEVKEKEMAKEKEKLIDEETLSSIKELPVSSEERIANSFLITRRKEKLFHSSRPLYGTNTRGEKSHNDLRDIYKIDPTYSRKQDEVIAYIQNKFGTEIKFDESQFKNSYLPPSVLGVSQEDIDSRLEELMSVGFTSFECAKLLPVLPFCVRIDIKGLHDVCRLLEEYNIRWAHFLNHGLVHLLLLGTSNVTTLSTNLQHLKSFGVHFMKIKALLMNCPLLLVFPLTHTTIETLLKTNREGFTGQWIENTLHDALIHKPLHVSLGSDTSKIIRILTNFNINPDFMLRKFPNFFLMKEEQLFSVLKVLSGQPFYFDTTAVASIITTCPQIVSSISDETLLRKQLTSFKDLLLPSLTVQAIGALLVKVPSIIDPKRPIEQRISLLEKEMKFSHEQIHKMILSAPSILIHEEENLKERINLLFSLQDSSPAALTSAITESATLFKKSLSDLKARYNYTKKYNESLLHVDKLYQLFGSSDEKFAQLFDHSPVQYLREAAESKWIDSIAASEKISRFKHSLLPKKKRRGTKQRALSRVYTKDEQVNEES